MSTPYRGQSIALLTQHGKERVLAEVLEPAVGCNVMHVTGFDTDQLGTFTRDRCRSGSKLDAARRKARIGMQLSGLDVGLASEGSFTQDPYTGSFPWNIELLVLLDDPQGVELMTMTQGPARDLQLKTSEWSALLALAIESDFPNHQLVLRPNGPDDHRIYKGIADWDVLRITFDICMRLTENGQVFVESDLRAFANPTRMERIAQAAHDLVQRMCSSCPACSTPGYWISERTSGLPCAGCRRPTTTYRTEVWSCLRCSYRVIQERTDLTHANPRECQRCNP